MIIFGFENEEMISYRTKGFKKTKCLIISIPTINIFKKGNWILAMGVWGSIGVK